ncbi:hypothetical protein XELAEV_18028168mg [Xenopus laevis]|uniref:Uncharacterized protein n=1 Tax=Xenopus laevis TaxID=8355 RepID=A0A974HKF5_XENLA|nr:hypothetical protein XELAEV_18028168mg [Xenopus laevis]
MGNGKGRFVGAGVLLLRVIRRFCWFSAEDMVISCFLRMLLQNVYYYKVNSGELGKLQASGSLLNMAWSDGGEM